jgi:DNA topoisomerase-1
LRLGKRGAFIGCSNYPTCSFTRPLTVDGGEGEPAAGVANKVLGVDPATQEEIQLRNGPFGPYVQLGTGGAKPKDKPKRQSVPKDMKPDEVTLDLALKLLSLPRLVGKHPETGETILAGLGRFGPYLKHGEKYKSIQTTQDALEIGLNRAVDVLAQPSTGRRFGRAAAPVGRVVGDHPEDGAPITAAVGSYGPYVKHGSTYANLPKDLTPEEVSLDDAVRLIAERRARAGNAPVRKKAVKKVAKPKSAPKATTEAPPKAAPKAKRAKNTAAPE